MTVEINLTDEPDFVSAERAALLIILKALDKGFEFDIEKPLDFSIHELSCQAMNYLIYEAWEPEVFAQCLITDIDKKNKRVSYKWEDGFGLYPEGLAREYYDDVRAYETEPGEWEYIKKGDERFDKAHRLVTKMVDSVGRMIQLYC